VRYQKNGDGHVPSSDYLPVPSTALHVAVADLNADAAVDLIVGHADGVTILRGGADGTFTAEADAVSWPGRYPIAGDFTGDGAVDVVTANATGAGGGSLTLFVNRAHGTTSDRAGRPRDR
jgi:hypothetical protein